MHRIALKCGRIYRSIPRFVNNSLYNYNKCFPRLQYSTTPSSVGSKYVSNERNDVRHEPHIQSRDENKVNESIDSIKLFAEENILQVNFTDGQVVNFNTIWLRDSCHCSECLHPITKTKLINCADISDQLFADRIDCSHNTIEICWRDAREDRDGPTREHISHYSVNWLKKFVGVFTAFPETRTDLNFPQKVPNDGIYGPTLPQPKEVYWDSSLIDKNKFTVDYNEFMSSSEALKKVIHYICEYGVVFIDSVPVRKNAILEVARRIAYEKRTGYGVTFDVTYNPDPNTHLSYTGAKFEPHIDLAYRERSPGIQMLHCLEQASVGGQSFLVDGFKCAQLLRESDSQLFDLLTKYPVLFTFCDAERGLWFREKWPIIQLNTDHTIKEIHFSDFSMRAPLLPVHLLDNFYKAYRNFTALIRDHKYQYKYYMKAGDLVIFNNRRVLHGRDEYNHNTQKRHLEGCYLDLDEVMSLSEKFNS